MQVKPEQLQRYYASITDEMLLDVDPAELTDLAREVWERELEARGLAGGAVPLVTEQEGDVEIEPDWLEHAACPCSFTAAPGSHHAPDAARARDALIASGVPCHLEVVPPDPPETRYEEYRVLVPSALNLKAIAVLDKAIFNAELEADWRTHFADLSDEELRTLKPEVICAGLVDRVERLTRAYNEEMARRQSGKAISST